MSDWKCRAEIDLVTEEELELRLVDSTDDGRYLSWKIPLSEANDLASWWAEEIDSETRRLPVKDLRYRSIQISMYSPTLAQIKGFDAYGTPNIVGCSLPKPLLEALVHYFTVPRESNRPSTTTSEHEGGLRPWNGLEAPFLQASPPKDRIAVYFFDSNQHTLLQTTTQDVTSPSESRKEAVYHAAG